MPVRCKRFALTRKVGLEMKSKVKKLASTLAPDIIRFTQQLIRTKSFTAQEGDLAKLVKRKMMELDYDNVFVDTLGNVIGVIGEGPVGILLILIWIPLA